MAREIKEPDNRPQERMERLINESTESKERRIHQRVVVEPGAEVIFPVICRGEVMDVSEEGISIRFKPTEAPSLQPGETVSISMPLESHSFKLHAEVKRVESRFGVIILGMRFDPEQIELEDEES
jgi:hypothetical protein